MVDGTCERLVANGNQRCWLHGQKTPSNAAKAAQRRSEARVRRLVAETGWQPVTDPLAALAELLGEVAAVKDAFAGRVNELHELTVADQLGREDVRALLAAYERALDRCGRLLVDASRLDLEARITRVREAQAAMVMAALAKTLGHPDLGLDGPRQARARALLAGELVPAATK